MAYADDGERTAREKGNAALSRWRGRNREKVREQKRRYAQKHPDKVKAWNRTQYLRHHEARKATQRAYGQLHREEKKAAAKAWHDANIEKVKAYRQTYWRNRRGTSLLQRVKKQPGCDLTAEWIQSRLDAGVCEMSGLPFDMESKRGANSPSIDRIDPAGAYTMANCRVILWFLNRAMSNLGEEYALRVFAAVLAKRTA